MANPIIEYGFRWTHLITTAQVSTSRGILHSITINRPDPHAGGVVTVYDSAAGVTADIIAIIAMDSALFVVPATLIYDAEFLNGLYIAFDAATTLGDITVSWK